MTTRARIVEFLERNSPSTSEEIGRSLQIPLANVRHHLRSLLIEGPVIAVEQGVIKGRGRPPRLYGLSTLMKSHNLDGLASAALGAFLAQVPSGAYHQGLQEIASRIAPPPDTIRSVSLTGRLTRTIRRLNELNYRARWEAHRDAPHVILGHCPYAAVLAEHPELCQVDTLVIQNLLGAPARQVKKLARDSRGSRYCLFVVEPVK